jgi:hypothetical protein
LGFDFVECDGFVWASLDESAFGCTDPIVVAVYGFASTSLDEPDTVRLVYRKRVHVRVRT